MTLYTVLVWAPILFTAGLVASSLFTRRGGVALVAGLTVLVGSFLLRADALPLVAYPRAVLAEPSMGLVVACLVCGVRRFAGTWTGNGTYFHAAVLILALGLYPLSLGLGFFDPYALGYRPIFTLGLVIVALVLWWIPHAGVVAVWLTLSILAHRSGFGESDNLWDFLIDPLVVAVAMGFMTGRLAKAIGVARVTN